MIIFLEIQVRGPKVNIEKTPSLHYIIIPECIFIIINIIRMHLERKIFEKNLNITISKLNPVTNKKKDRKVELFDFFS
jgi:hypothetical protein